tara:strand:- start:136 stop:360 length:225 start_codon:yes stop_codon:yes gene_type:complete
MTKQKTRINIHTNTDSLCKAELLAEASTSKKRSRVQLLNKIHSLQQECDLMETAYAYDPQNDMSFTGEFEAIGI